MKWRYVPPRWLFPPLGIFPLKFNTKVNLYFYLLFLRKEKGKTTFNVENKHLFLCKKKGKEGLFQVSHFEFWSGPIRFCEVFSISYESFQHTLDFRVFFLIIFLRVQVYFIFFFFSTRGFTVWGRECLCSSHLKRRRERENNMELGRWARKEAQSGTRPVPQQQRQHSR